MSKSTHCTPKGKELFACFGEHIVRQDEVWLMSDYEKKSFDSRYFCAVPRENIIGRARLVLRLPGQSSN